MNALGTSRPLAFQHPLSRVRGGLRDALVLALIGAFTTWVALLSWKGFAMSWGGFMGPLVTVAIVVAVSGAVLRWLRVPGPLLVLAQVVLVGMVVSMQIAGTPFPIGEGWERMDAAFADAIGHRQAVRRPGADQRTTHRPAAHRRWRRLHADGRHRRRHDAAGPAGRAATADDLQHPRQPARAAASPG